MMQGIVILVQTRRKFFVGLNAGYASNGEPDERLVDFYSRRSSPSLYCAIVGNVVLPGGYPSNARTPTISTSPIWSTIAREIYHRSTLPGIQLATAWNNYRGQRSFRSKDSKEAIAYARQITANISKQDVKQLFVSLDKGTALALDAGFHHVQLHAAHGYLFSLLIDRRLFSGADEVLTGIARWAQIWSSVDVELSIRFSLRTGDPEFDAEGSETFQHRVASLPLHYIDVSSGFYNIDKQLIYPARPDTLAARRKETLTLASKHQKTSFIYSGRALLHPEDGLPSNVHIGLCRDLIANPYYLNDRTQGCLNSGKCHYYSRNTPHVMCPRWDELYPTSR